MIFIRVGIVTREDTLLLNNNQAAGRTVTALGSAGLAIGRINRRIGNHGMPKRIYILDTRNNSVTLFTINAGCSPRLGASRFYTEIFYRRMILLLDDACFGFKAEIAVPLLLSRVATGGFNRRFPARKATGMVVIIDNKIASY